MCRFQEAVEQAKQALACNPFSVRIRQHLGYCLYCSRKYDEAIQQYLKALDLDPKDPYVCEALADAFGRKGEYREAIEFWTKTARLADDPELVAALRVAYTKESFEGGVRSVAAKRLGRLQCDRDNGAYVPAIRFAREHLRAGNTEETFKWLALACEERNAYSLMIGSDPFYDPLRTDQRFGKLLRRMKLDG
jgi:tetratricopeptide (TPR) repeat protein